MQVFVRFHSYSSPVRRHDAPALQVNRSARGIPPAGRRIPDRGQSSRGSLRCLWRSPRLPPGEDSRGPRFARGERQNALGTSLTAALLPCCRTLLVARSSASLFVAPQKGLRAAAICSTHTHIHGRKRTSRNPDRVIEACICMAIPLPHSQTPTQGHFLCSPASSAATCSGFCVASHRRVATTSFDHVWPWRGGSHVVRPGGCCSSGWRGPTPLQTAILFAWPLSPFAV